MNATRSTLAGVLAASLTPAALAAPEPPLDCVIEPSMVVQVGSEADGVLASVEVGRGHLVEAGQLLATLVDDLERASASLYRARAGADASIRLGRVRTAFGERSAERIRRLQRASIASEQEVDRALTDEHLERLRLEEAETNQRLARLEYGRAQAALEQRRIVSPVRALVVDRLKHPGERVSEEPILTLAAIDTLHVEVIAPVSMLGQIRPGQGALVSPEQPVGGEYPATVSVVDRVMDARSGTFGVRLALPNADHALPAGLRCTIRFQPLARLASLAEAAEAAEAGRGPGSAEQPAAAGAATPAAPAAIPPQAKAPPSPTPPTAEQREAPRPAGRDEGLGARAATLAESILNSALPEARAASAPTAAGPDEPTAGPADEHCLRAGPFHSRRSAESMAQLLRSEGTHAAVHGSDGPPRGYLLLVAGGARTAEELHRAGVRDTQILRKGPFAGEVSVGYFGKQRHARARQQQLAAAGVNARVVPRGRRADRFWLGVRTVDRAHGEREARRIGGIAPGMPVRPLDCDETRIASN
jgi:RND family efflux transporter MFP subunit